MMGAFSFRQRLSPWESWREAPERARLLKKKHKRRERIALTKSLPIAVQRLCRDRLTLSVIASQCHLSQRERLLAAPLFHKNFISLKLILINSSGIS